MNEEEKRQSEDLIYLKGFHNKMMRYYFYLMSGLGILNNFRNLFLGIFALYIALKLDNVLYGIIIFIVSSIVLTICGYYNVHRVSKISEWLGVRFSSHFGIKSFNYTQENNELLKEIRDILKNK